MSLPLLATFAVQGYIALAGLLLAPLYLHLLGQESFGLVGISILLQSALQLLDAGMTPTISREVALLNAGAQDQTATTARIKSIRRLFYGIGALLVVALLPLSGWLAEYWLTYAELDYATVRFCIIAMGTAAVLRWCTGISRGTLIGFEQHGTLNAINLVTTTLRYLGVVPVLYFLDSSVTTFFSYQLLIGAGELWVLYNRANRVLPSTRETPSDIRANFGYLWPLASQVAVLSAIWITITQIDKLILSVTLPLAQYAVFTLAVLAANSLTLAIPAMQQVIQPRLTILTAGAGQEQSELFYSTTTQVITLLCAAAAGVMAVHGKFILTIWVGDESIATQAAGILAWYALANVLAIVLAMPFMLQFALGKLKLHLTGNLIQIAVLIPCLVVTALSSGARYTGLVYLVARLLFIILWVPRIHARYAPSLKWKWSLRDVLLPACTVVLTIWVLDIAAPTDRGWSGSIALIGASVIMALALGSLTNIESRKLLTTWLRNK
jgi:O-antigen/teichoic acid export membrane protein